MNDSVMPQCCDTACMPQNAVASRLMWQCYRVAVVVIQGAVYELYEPCAIYTLGLSWSGGVPTCWMACIYDMQ